MTINRYDVIFDQSYMEGKGLYPRGPIRLTQSLDYSIELVQAYFEKSWHNLKREVNGSIHYPYLVPGAQYDALWDWDSFFVACAIPDEGLVYAKGTVLNLVTNATEEGRPPKQVRPSGELNFGEHPIPVLAQFVYIVATRLNDFSWVEPIWDQLEKIALWHERTTMKEGKYYTWLSLWGNGIDNNPAVYGRPVFSSAGVDLATWHYREFKALAKISNKLNKNTYTLYQEKAEQLKSRIQIEYWDQVDQFFYNIDCTMDAKQSTLQGINWKQFLKFRSWACLFPMWGKIATESQAEQMVSKIMSLEEYLAPCGIRSHSAIDPIYNNVQMGNPSNWQGPVWGLSTFVTSYALDKYGYRQQALETSNRLIHTFGNDIHQNGCVHEYYNGDTGQPLIRPEFISWNLLALRINGDLNRGMDGTTLDLLDE